MTATGLHIRLLGELQVIRDGRSVVLPASRKTRALLGFLVATGCPHSRERLCDLLWDGPDDPRAALRWSLTKLRPLLEGMPGTRLVGDRRQVAFDGTDVGIDVVDVARLVGDDPSAASTERLAAAAGMLRGDFLEGLDLTDCYRFWEWCAAEREALARRRMAVLGTLVSRLEAQAPESALNYARALAAAEPTCESAHAAVVRILGRLGRGRDALGQYEHCRALLSRELGVAPSAELERARLDVTRRRPAPPPPAPEAAAPAPEPPAVLVGRTMELQRLQARMASAADGAVAVALIDGVPGIGKTRLLDEVHRKLGADGWHVLRCRAFESERLRPYGLWTDALRTLPVAADRDELAPLLTGAPAAAGNRAALFEAARRLVQRLSDTAPVAVFIDDAQWADDASLALLHYVVRSVRRLLVVVAARRGELDDNLAALGLIRDLARAGLADRLTLGPLALEETEALVRAAAPTTDARAVAASSDGNPLFALTLAHAPEGRGHATLRDLLEDQLARLEPAVAEVLPWAAALGCAFDVALLERVSAIEGGALLAALDVMERRGVVRVTEGRGYVFAHDFIRDVAYRRLSEPRRCVVHRRIAMALAPLAEEDTVVATAVARHAMAAGDDALAAEACVRAGEQCLGVFANAEALQFAAQGLGHVERLPPTRAARRWRVGLLRIRVLASSTDRLRRWPHLVEHLRDVVADVEAAKQPSDVAVGHYLLSVVLQDAGRLAEAQEESLAAAAAAQAADAVLAATQMANTARCVAELAVDMERARHLLNEAERLVGPLGVPIAELEWGLGLMCRWDGDLAAATAHLEQAASLVARNRDRWREYKCLAWLTVVDLERRAFAGAAARVRRLREVAVKAGGEPELAFAEALDALAWLGQGERGAPARLDAAADALLVHDSKAHLALVLILGAEVALGHGRRETAERWACTALAAAESVGRRCEWVVARAVLAQAGAVRGGVHRALDDIDATQPDLSAGARAALSAARAIKGIDRQLPGDTEHGQDHRRQAVRPAPHPG
ncbi:MAG TPA: AAA family ATPase [Azospirillum sp.]|nr:AAA family ATPase [Azospirillum sp.]